MGAVQSRLVINDGMTPALRHINNAMKLMIDNFEAVRRASGRSINTSNLSATRQELGKANALLDEMEQQYRELNQQQDSLNKNLSTGKSNAGGLLNKIKGMVGAYAGVQGLQALVGLSDDLASQSARLELIVDDGGSVEASVEALEQKIFASAQSARASYTDTMATVAKLGLTAGDAFSNNDELIKFTELINKNFVIGGASSEEQASAMYQLTQAMSAGKLQGDEFRSIMDSAPLLAGYIEDYMRNVQGATGSMKDWAAEGLLTADVIKAAVFDSAGDVEERFNQMPMTWAQVFTSMKNQAIQALKPLLQKINELANDPQMQQFIANLMNNFTSLANWATVAIDVIIQGFLWMQEAVQPINDWLATQAQRISENWSSVAPVISAVAMALMILAGVFLAYKAVMAIATAAQWLYNTSLFGCPLVWILVIIIAVIAAVYGIVAAINKVTGSTISATGVIMGALATVGAFIWNSFLGLLESVLRIINYLVNPIIAFVNFFGNVFNDPVGSIIHLFVDLADNVLATIQKIASALDFVFGSNMADTVQGWRDSLASKAEIVAKEYGNGQYEEVMGALDLSVDDLGLRRIAYSDAWEAGYQMGENIDNGIANFSVDSLLSDAQSSLDAASFGNTLGSIAGDTSDIADSVDKTTEELEYLRDIAEQEAINRFTTAEVKVDMTGMTNRIDSSMDIDGVVNQLTAGFVDALSTAAEGVHDDEL